jgi:hypothetical protein
MTAQLSLGPKAVLSHRAAAAVIGMDGVGPGVVEVTVPTGGQASRRDPAQERSA